MGSGTPPPASSPTSTTSTLPPSRPVSAVFSGTLVSPSSSTADTYSVPNFGGSVTASATWSGGAQLSLTVNCPGGQQSASGASGLTVSTTSLAGTCYVIIGAPQGSVVDAPYQLTVTYPG
jgi:hypothetical protein